MIRPSGTEPVLKLYAEVVWPVRSRDELAAARASATEQAERMLAGRYEKFTEQTITTPARMRRELDEVRRKQYARNIEELLPGYWVLAGRVRGAGGATLAAISLTLAIEHLEKGSEARYAAMVRDACQKASLQLGFRAGEAA